MRWPWKQQAPDRSGTERLVADARKGLAESRQTLTDSLSTVPRTTDVSDKVRARLRQNHFAPELMHLAFRRGETK